MANPKKDAQLTLFGEAQQLSIPGAWDCDKRIRRLVSEALGNARLALGKDRFAVAAEIARMIDLDFSESVLNQYSSESRDNYQFPANKVAAFCHAVRDVGLVRIILAPLVRHPDDLALVEEMLRSLGIELFDGAAGKLAEIGKCIVEQKRSRKDALELLREYMDGV